MQQKMDEIAAIAAALEANKKKNKHIVGPAKLITLAILSLAFAFGVYGSFNDANFNMAEYTSFIESFSWFFAPLILSIGAGAATNNLKKKDQDHE